MVMKKLSPWIKNNIREVKHTWERYLAIFAIIGIGVAFFAGLVITRDSMVATLNKYLTDHNFYDYRLLSTLAFDLDDPKAFLDLEEVKYAEGGITIDFLGQVSNQEQELVLKAHSISDELNKLQLISGRLPESDNEIVVDSMYFSPDLIGETIILSSNNDEDTSDSFKYEEYKIVGLVRSPEYISAQRGTTNLASGSISAFVYIPKGGFDLDYYTEIYLKLNQSASPFSEEYKDLISSNEDKITALLETRAETRFDKILKEANQEIADAEAEYQDGLNEFQSEKEKVNKELEDAYSKLLEGQDEIKENEKKLLDGEKDLEKGWKEYREGLKKYQDGLAEYEANKASTLKTFEDKQKEIDENRTKVLAGLEEIESAEHADLITNYDEALVANIAKLQEAKAQIEASKVIDTYNDLLNQLKQIEEGQNDTDEYRAIIEANLKSIKDTGVIDQYQEITSNLAQLEMAKKEIDESGVRDLYLSLRNALKELDEGQAKLDEGKSLANAEFVKAEKELAKAKEELDSALDMLNSSQRELEDGKRALEEGKAELRDGFAEYEEGKAEALESFAEAEEELADARIKIDDAKKEIADLKHPETFVFDRSHNTGYSSFDDDSSIVAGIAKVLPIFFFLVAGLVCSTTMARMVDEQRTQIGTLKALGFSDMKITNKYVSYSASAAILGCIIGYILGTKYFPMAIWVAYGMLYNFAPLEFVFDPYLAIIALVVSLLCSAGVTFATCKNELIKPPAELIRPKAPKAGKRIFLERIPAIWNRIGFLRKVAIRNIFRFKKRLLMTVMGVAGCTALIIAALGIEDSIGNIANYQFDDIMNYDYEIYYQEEVTKEAKEDFNEKYADILADNVFIVKETFEIMKGNQTKSFTLIASDDEKLTKLIDFHLEDEKVPFPKDGEVLLSHKLAKDAGVGIGDTVKIKISDTENVDAVIGGIFENYINNYMYMSEATYKTLFDKELKYLNSFATTNLDDLDRVTSELTNDDNIVAIVSSQSIRSSVEDTMSSLNYVVWLVLGFAIALAFVVVYNLNNINITERAREIATLKVLGFYPNETYIYVYRENITLTGIGIVAGLFLGKWLLTFVMNAITVDFVTFKQQIFPQSYLMAVIATFLLTILVNLILRNKIDYINMAESLNSGE